MTKQLGTVWALEPHTAKKHEILRRYFEAWLPILANSNGRVVYIDGFAGPQWPGKPSMWAARLVLQSKPKWLRHFYLYETNKKKVKLLRTLCANKRVLAP